MNALTKYAKAGALGIQNAMEYRADFLLGMVSALFPMFIQYFMWSAIYNGSGSASLFGYTYAQMLVYTVVANIVQRLLRTGFEYEINDDIKLGGLDKFLVRPIGYFFFRMVNFLGGKLVQGGLIYVVMVGAILALNAALGAIVTPLGLLWFTLVLLLAFLLNYVIFFLVGMLAFWLSEVGFLFEAVRIVFIAFSGGIFPLDVFGPRIVAVLNWLPFRYTVNFPVDVLCGRIAGLDVLLGCAAMALWVAVLSGLAMLTWRTGLKRYVAAGG